ncbi:hypothetical protein CLHUN_11870 [Ruminiclostridium hungatei]|uniref:Uncharacterized protein n=1 Tax=Ruminiclostridium hungatei TaxID=48256 RepID=A0A1V4SNB0_RUMHU|nr:hypothetical protein CLHUN_11870 [Ruminiclostridium hungatei]
MYCINMYSIDLCTQKINKADTQGNQCFNGNLHWFDPHLNKCCGKELPL